MTDRLHQALPAIASEVECGGASHVECPGSTADVTWMNTAPPRGGRSRFLGIEIKETQNDIDRRRLDH